MCNLYRMTKNPDEVAKWFGALNDVGGGNFGAEVYPGYPGLVLTEGRVRQMTWGFPLARKGKQGQPLKPKPVNNAREDKLTGGFWRDSFAKRRCLIPVTDWGEAEGEKGRMTRTWYAVPGQELFAVAGLWRPTAEWGHAYAMVMCDSCEQMAEVHDRMPVILAREHWDEWQHGEPEQALGLCRKWGLELRVERTDERWAGGGAARLL
jgi:putative SOS response-associated peptidase YedK